MDASSPPAETPSSLSDFYASDSPNRQPEPEQSAPAETPDLVHREQATATPVQDEEQDMDTSSDMDTEDSDHSPPPESDHPPEPESEPLLPQLPVAMPVPGSSHTAVKRTLEDADLDTNGDTADSSLYPNQRRRLSDQPSHFANGTAPTDPAVALENTLPVELLQRVFVLLSPATLATCLRVSKTFHRILTDTKADATSKKNTPELRVLSSDAVWAQARKNYYSSFLPKPLANLTELQMFQLIGAERCMVLKQGRPCGKVTRSPPLCTSAFDRGPGPDGVRAIWAFGMAMCGECLQVNTCTDIQLLQSQRPILRTGLAHIFLTPDLNYIPDSHRAVSQIPSHLRAQKVYHIDHVKTIEHDYDEVRSYGDGAAEEWTKGLRTRGTERIADAARWEAFESRLPPHTSLTDVLREYDPSSFPRYHEKMKSRSVQAVAWQPSAVANGVSTLPQPVYGFQIGQPASNLQYTAPSGQPQRILRTAEDAELARQARKAEIERRCLELQPPIAAEVLPFMQSFKNAMAIAQPLTDAGWEDLRPRLLDQLEHAMYLYAQHGASAAHQEAPGVQAVAPTPNYDDSYFKRAKEVYTAEYENAQAPLRKKLGEYVDEYHNLVWPSDLAISFHSCAAFATNSIVYVHKRYVEDKAAGNLPGHGQTTGTGSGHSTPTEPFLSLDNMKWVYDNKIKPLTDTHRRELFACSECNDPRKPKSFAFEGFIQHYASKHTVEFSKGNAVVHWQTAEWPEDISFVVVQPSKQKRKSSDHAGNGSARRTPRANRDGPFKAPKNGKLLSETPYFSGQAQQSPQLPSYNGYSWSGPQHEGYSHGQPSQPLPPYGFPTQQMNSNEPVVDTSETAQVNKLSADACEVWEKLDGVKNLLAPIRMQTVIHHTTQRFSDYYNLWLTLDLFTEAMAANATFKPLKNAGGLACKVCVASQPDGSGNHPAYHERTRNAKMHTLGTLITHIKITHQPENHHMEWMKDIIEMPEDKLINDLMRTPGMDDEKLALVAAAFPRAFPSPLPAIGLVTEEGASKLGMVDNGLASRLLGHTAKKGSKKKRKGQAGSIGTPPQAKDDEYDPRRPAYVIDEEQAFDPARYDTDLARKTTAAPTCVANVNLAPDTLAALNALAARPQRERSPSVGAPARPPSSSNAAPDISAILASLTGQSQTTTAAPPSTVSTSSSSAPRQPYSDPYYQPQDATPYAYPPMGPTTLHYAPPPPPQPAYAPQPTSPAGYAGQDLQAVLARNTHSYEYNRAQTMIPAERVSVAPPPAQRSPPRLRVVYEDAPGAYAQPPPPQYQYVQLAPADHARGVPLEQQGGAHYAARAPPTTVWVDEHGRPLHLVPVDAAPAPVQYAPHPYEQQWRGRYE